MRALVIFVFATLGLAFSAQADMYRCMDESGTVSYGDAPCKTLPAPSKKAAESFSANILIVKSHADIESWVRTEPAKRRGDVGRARTVATGAKVYLPIVATFPQSQVGQRIALVADFEIVAPSGKRMKIPSCCMANRVDPRAPATIVLGPVVDVTLDATDPKGEYRVRALINNGKETAVAEEAFRLQ